MVRIRIHTSVRALEQLRRLWEFIGKQGQRTVFQSFDWNLLAARQFSDREEPFVVVSEASYGLAIVPAARSLGNGSLRLLGEELFDYRSFLCAGEDDVLRSALATLAQAAAPLETLAVRECDRSAVLENLQLEPFTLAPAVKRAEISGEAFGSRHSRLARNLRRFQRRGFEIKIHSGENSSLVRLIYESKARHDPRSLFHNSQRVAFMVEAGQLQPSRFEVVTLESETELAAALVILREPEVRRFYTCYFPLEFAKLSPAMALIHKVTRQSLESGLDCDYMTGEQGYKMRLATSSMALYRLRATPDQLAAMAGTVSRLRRAV
jgi:CelD/BcsL family acetyltransferase involved in cellulose biosynthesis